MSELDGLFAFLREKSEEDVDLEQLCGAISRKYLEKQELDERDQYAREENIILKLDVANLESILDVKMSNDDALSELHTLLMEFDKEHFKMVLDIDYIIAKLNCYEKIRTEIGARNHANAYQQLYSRKLNMSKKLEERHVVKEYRQKERERTNTKNERIRLEERVKQKLAEIKAMSEEANNCILRLVKGLRDLEDFRSHQSEFNENLPLRGSKVSSDKGTGLQTNNIEEKPQPRGLSSRLHLVFNDFKIPSVVNKPKMKINNPTGCKLLFRQADFLRKSIHQFMNPISDHLESPQRLKGILKNPIKTAQVESKSTEEDCSVKDHEQKINMKRKSEELILDPPKKGREITDHDNSTNFIDMSLELVSPSVIEDPVKAQLNLNKTGSEQVVETNVSETNSSHSEQKICNKRKAENGNVISTSLEGAQGTSIHDSSKGFMEIFCEFEQDSLASSFRPATRVDATNAIKSPQKKPKIEILENIVLIPSGSTLPFQVKAKAGDSKSVVSNESSKKSHESLGQNLTNTFTGSVSNAIENNNGIGMNVPKRGKTVSFDDFDDFFSDLGNNGVVGSDNSDDLADMSFNFMEGNENTADEDDHSSFRL